MSVINTNIKSLMAQDSLTINNRSLTQSMQRLSTGLKINSAADDAAGLGISTRMDAQVRGLNMAIKNANDTISMVQTAEGAMQEVTSILQRMRELSVQSASDTNGSVDRAYLQAEVSQLSSEIDRISNTTQWNSMNILDGSYKNKLFQIGANQGQTIGLSIGSMNSKVLGVASSQTGVINGADTGVEISGAMAKGVQADDTVVRLKFEKSDTYTFTLADSVTGLPAAGVSAKVLDLNSANSRQDFIDELNLNLQKSAVDTKIVGSSTTWNANVDLTNPDNYESVKFTIAVDGGTPAKAIDLRSRLLATAGVTATAVTGAQVATAMQTELQAAFDTSITVTQAAGVFTVTDAQGRSIEISQGAGDGALFGTDAANDGALSIDAQMQNTISAAWDGNDIVVTNSSGGKLTVAGYVAAGSSKVIFDTVSDGQAGQDYDPVALVGANTSAATQAFAAKVEASQISMVFSDRIGDGTDALYKFKLTDGAGHAYADLSAGLNVKSSATAADIVAAVKTALGTGVAALADESIDVTDFQVSFVGNTLSITNTEGVALAVEDFSSTAGGMTVTPNNELGATTYLASQNAYYSTARWAVNSADLGGNFSAATDEGKFNVYVDGIKSTAGIAMTFDGTTDNATLSSLATSLQAKLRALTDVKIPGSDAVQSLAAVTVTADADTGSLLIRDDKGREITISPLSTNDAPGVVFVNPSVTATRNDGKTVRVDSGIAQGDAYAATQVTMTLNMAKADFDFSLNGMFLADATSTAAAATVTWDSTQPFAGSTMQTKLDALMTKLNSAHGSNVFEYSVSGNSITFLQRDGGPIEIGEFETGTGYDGLKATLTPAAGQGTEGVMQVYKANATAYAEGTTATTTSAVLQLTGDDVISLSISDGANTYVLSDTAVDVGNLASAQALSNKLNDVLGGSTIRASMDVDGNISFTDTTGGTIALTVFNSSRGLSATWSPEAGQGDDLAISGSYQGSASVATPSLSVGGGSTAVSQISVLTQDGASKAMAVIDNALTYVNAERAKLGAVENRLTHTIDNLTNIVTNTQASKSRITDTDYAQETSKLARAQIIQQAATAMLAQANQAPQSVLALLK
jgi:flagellin